MSLSLIGYGKTSVKPFTTNHKEITQKNITPTRKIIVKVIIINTINNCLQVIGYINHQYLYIDLSLKLCYVYRLKLNTQNMDSLVKLLYWEQ